MCRFQHARRSLFTAPRCSIAFNVSFFFSRRLGSGTRKLIATIACVDCRYDDLIAERRKAADKAGPSRKAVVAGRIGIDPGKAKGPRK